MFLINKICNRIARHFSEPREKGLQVTTNSPDKLSKTLMKGDVLLVEGTSRISDSIKYLTQSTWSHAALCIGKPPAEEGEEARILLEADINEGVRTVPLSTYFHMHTRICRPVGLSDYEIDMLVKHATSKIGHQYDLKNIFDLAKYLIRTPIPGQHRRNYIMLGSGDPSKAICSSIIALAFQHVQYPILPEIDQSAEDSSSVRTRELNHLIRHHSLFAPRDFDISPFFRIIKPTIDSSFEPSNFNWSETDLNDKKANPAV